MNEFKTLYQGGNYEGVMKLRGSEASEWDYVFSINAAYKLNDFSACSEIYREFKAKYPGSGLLDNTMCRALYYFGVKDFDFNTGDREALKKKLRFILDHSEAGQFSLKPAAVKFIIRNSDKLYDNPDDGQRFALEALLSQEPSSLPNTPVRTPDGKELAGERESWYSNVTKLLLTAKRFDECAKYCAEALNSLSSFHSRNDCWFRYRQVQCLMETGETGRAERLLEEITARGLRHWKIDAVGMTLEKMLGNIGKALSHLGRCALADEEHDKRVKFYPEASRVLLESDMVKEARLHRLLAVRIREENHWRVNPEDAAEFNSEEFTGLSSADIIKQLKPLWRRLSTGCLPRAEGVITGLIADDTRGFIEGDDGKRYFFLSRDMRGRKPAPGQRVKFAVTRSYDAKRDKMSDSATDITLADKE